MTGPLLSFGYVKGFPVRLYLASNATFRAQSSYQCVQDGPADGGDSCAVMLSTEAAPWYQDNAPGLIRSISAMFFPVGLIMIVLSGAHLLP